jgi:hypothetical protein
MLLLAPREESLDLAPPWIDQSQFLGEPMSDLDGGITDWFQETSQSISPPDPLIRDTTSSIYGTISTSAARVSTMDKDVDALADSAG